MNGGLFGGAAVGGTGARRVEAAGSADHFPTPPWATRALLTYVIPGVLGPGVTVWEPCAGAGDMVRPLADSGAEVVASDIYDYGADYELWDFTERLPDGGLPWLWRGGGVQWVVTNPPFNRAQEIVARALEVAQRGVAVLVRLAWLEGVERYQTLYRDRPPAIIAPFAERVPMVRGRLDASVSTNMAYAWLVWGQPQFSPTRVVWIPPCRKALERVGDYPAAEVPLLEGL